MIRPPSSALFFFNDTATTEIYTLSLHDALPICPGGAVALLYRGWNYAVPRWPPKPVVSVGLAGWPSSGRGPGDRKSTRLNSSHGYISYAVFCLKKKKKHHSDHTA